MFYIRFYIIYIEHILLFSYKILRNIVLYMLLIWIYASVVINNL